GIRGATVTGVQTCALPISRRAPALLGGAGGPLAGGPRVRRAAGRAAAGRRARGGCDARRQGSGGAGAAVRQGRGTAGPGLVVGQIGRASCRERGGVRAVAG